MTADALGNKDVLLEMESCLAVRRWVFLHPLAVEVPHWSNRSKGFGEWAGIVMRFLREARSRLTTVREFFEGGPDTVAFHSQRVTYQQWRRQIRGW
jgi:hypothetical protein